jgi:hypothetical protein
MAKAANLRTTIVAPGKDCFRGREIAWIIDVEKRVVWINRPIHDGAAVVLRESLDLPRFVGDEGVTQSVSDRYGPKRDGRMRPVARTRAGKQRVLSDASVKEADNEIGWQNGVSAGTLIAKGTAR